MDSTSETVTKNAAPAVDSVAGGSDGCTGGWTRSWMIVVFAAALAIRLPLMTQPGFGGDLMQFVMWADRGAALGTAALYDQRPDGRRISNYPPGYLYVLRGVARVHDFFAPSDAPLSIQTFGEVGLSYDSPEARRAYFFFKLPAVLADAALAMLLVGLLWGRVGGAWAASAGMACAMLPCMWHNSAAWGQMDGILALLLVLSLEAARRGRVGWMAAVAVAAMLTKPQAAMIAPIWIVSLVRAARADRQAVARAVSAAFVVAVALLWPVRSRLDGVWDALAGAAKYYPFTHLNGFSAWFLQQPIDAPDLGQLARVYARDDSAWLAGLKPRTIGLVAVIGIWTYVFVRARRVIGGADSIERWIDWAARVLPLAFFVLATQMHERYLFPAVAIWLWAARPTAAWAASTGLLALSVTVNQCWVWPGSAEGWYTEWARRAASGPWLGLRTGVYFSLVNAGLLAWTLARRPVQGR